MSINISGGQRENGILVGNLFDKYGSRNPIVRWLMSGFEEAQLGFVNQAHPTSMSKRTINPQQTHDKSGRSWTR